MNDLTLTLKNFGLEEQEAKTYLALLSLKEATATKLAERTKTIILLSLLVSTDI